MYDEAWLGGLWEGEGSVSPLKSAKSNLQMRLKMIDFGTVRHASKIAGDIGHFCVDRARATNNQLVWSITNFKHQGSLITQLLPYLFTRRVERIKELADYPYEYKEPTISLPWFIGFLEAEGNFNWNGSTQKISVASTDFEVIESVARYVDMGTVAPQKAYNRPEHYKPALRWAVYGQTARDMMRELYPYMSQRRQFQIDCAFAGKSIVDRPNYKTLCGGR